MKSVAVILISLISMVSMNAAPDSLRMFPNVAGENLHGETVEFPKVFSRNDCTAVIVAYERAQQEIINPWLPGLVELTKSRRGFEFFELPTIKKMSRLMRWIIYRGMRSGIEESKARSRTVTLHIDKAPFNKALGVTSEEQVYFFLVDPAGRIIWRETGEFNQEKLSQLTREVDRRIKSSMAVN